MVGRKEKIRAHRCLYQWTFHYSATCFTAAQETLYGHLEPRQQDGPDGERQHEAAGDPQEEVQDRVPGPFHPYSFCYDGLGGKKHFFFQLPYFMARFEISWNESFGPRRASNVALDSLIMWLLPVVQSK